MATPKHRLSLSGKGERRQRSVSPWNAPVLALVERGGRVRVSYVANVTAKTLRDAVRANVDAEAGS